MLVQMPLEFLVPSTAPPIAAEWSVEASAVSLGMKSMMEMNAGKLP